jgi:hypothetical protein
MMVGSHFDVGQFLWSLVAYGLAIGACIVVAMWNAGRRRQ